MSKDEVAITVTKSPDFKLIYANGVFGGLTPIEGRMIFYVDRLVPKIVADVSGQMKTDFVERELQVEVHMSPQEFLTIASWMQNHIQRMEKEGVLVKKVEEKKE